MTHVEKRQTRAGKETIHSGHFMVSHFEAEAQDDFDDLAVPVPDEEQNVQKTTVVATYTVPGAVEKFEPSDKDQNKQHQQLSIEISLTKLFKCMTLAYRQKLTSPKWNRFKGIKLRWKDKIRLNNVIWRCWHMQFIKKQNTLVCQFASPLDVDTHVKPEATILEGKYWKRRAEAVIAEYKKWRMFHIMRLLGKGDSSVQDTLFDQISDMDTGESLSQCGDLAGTMLTDEDYLTFMSDTLFTTITNHQPFAFPDCREIARGASLADFIQPSLGPLQPNLDDFMDTLEPLHDLLSVQRLPPVPEESALSTEDPYRGSMPVVSYTSQGYISGSQNSAIATMPTSQMTIQGTSNNTQMMGMSDQTIKNEQMRMYEENQRAMFGQGDMGGSMMGSQEMLQYPQPTYESPAQAEPMQTVYSGKLARLQYVSAPKIVSQQENTYTPQPQHSKYNAAPIPPSATAPETVSLLQQPVQNAKYAPGVVVPPRSGYTRDKPRSRITHYSSQIPNAHYPNYGQQMQQPVSPPVSARAGTGAPPPAQPTPAPAAAVHYLQPVEPYKPKTVALNSRAFKLPSPPLAPQTTQQVTISRNKDQFRSHSLPLGAQLNADWSVSAPVTAPAPLDRLSSNNRGRDVQSSAHPQRLRSRSSSSSTLVEGSSAGGGGGGGGGGTSHSARRPPPLNSVASEPALPQASVMLAQLLSSQHSQSLYKLNSSEEGASTSDPTRSPIRRGQPSPIGSDVMSPHQSLSPPTSPGSPRERAGSPGGGGGSRRTHLHAEQKRRCNIKNGFDTLQALIPHLSTNPAAKVSKAAMLQKGAEYIKQLKAERNQIKEEMESLRQQIECLNNSISNCHSLLPATGAPVSRARAGRLREMFARHVANRTMHNWKYWLFSVVAAALVDSFSACVSCGSGADLVRTTLLWAEQHCSLVEMRPAVLNSLRVLCTSTDILTNPERLPEEARAAVAPSAGVKTEPS